MASHLLRVTFALVLAAALALRPNTAWQLRPTPMITPTVGGSALARDRIGAISRARAGNALPSPLFIVAIKRPPKGKKAKCTHPKRTGDALCADCPRRR